MSLWLTWRGLSLRSLQSCSIDSKLEARAVEGEELDFHKAFARREIIRTSFNHF